MLSSFGKIYKILIAEKKLFFLIYLISILVLGLVEILGISSLSILITNVLNKEIFSNFSGVFFFEYFINLETNILIISIMLIYVIKIFIVVFINYKLLQFNNNLLIDLKNNIFKYYINLNYLEFNNISLAEKTRDIHNLTTQFISSFNIAVKTLNELILVFIITAFLLIYTNPYLIIALLVLALIVIIYLYFVRNILIDIGKNINSVRKKLYQILIEAMEGFIDIKVFDLVKTFEKTFNSLNKKLASQQIKFGLINLLPRNLLELTVIALVIIVVYMFSNLNQEMHIFYISLFASAGIKLIPSLNIIMNSSINIFNQKDTIDRLFNIFIKFKNFSFKPNKFRKININNLSVENISFKYEKKLSTNIIKNISFTLKKGDILGIKGRSGLGKTTLLNIITGLIKPDSGVIYYNSKHKINFNEEWIHNIAYIPQKPFILEGRAEDNISVGKKITKKELNFILTKFKLKKELGNKIINFNGNNISNGQKQRLIIARSHFLDRDIIIFDESTNSLDDENKKIILRLIQNLKNKIIICVSHDKDVLKICNLLLDLKKKKIEKN